MSDCHALACWHPHRLAGGALLSVLLHTLALGAIALGAPPPPVSSGGAAPVRITTLWLLRAPVPHVAVATTSSPVSRTRSHPAARDHAPRTAAVAFARPASAPQHTALRAAAATAGTAATAATVATATMGPVHGLAFATPRLRIGLVPRADQAAANAGAAFVPPPSPPRPPPSWPVQSMQQAAMREFGHRLQQHLSALARPADAQPGHCQLAPDDATVLVCDRPALQAVVAADAPALAGLMRAYRGLAAPAAVIALAYEQERFRLDLR